MLLSSPLYRLGIFLACNDPPYKFYEQEPTNNDTCIIHVRYYALVSKKKASGALEPISTSIIIRTSRRHFKREREENNRKDKPHDRNHVHRHSSELAHRERSPVHCSPAKQYICKDRNDICEVVDRAIMLSAYVQDHFHCHSYTAELIIELNAVLDPR